MHRIHPFIENFKIPTILQVSRVKHAMEWWVLNFMLVVTSRLRVNSIREAKEKSSIALIWIWTKCYNANFEETGWCSWVLVILFSSCLPIYRFLKKEKDNTFVGKTSSVLMNQQYLPANNLFYKHCYFEDQWSIYQWFMHFRL